MIRLETTTNHEAFARLRPGFTQREGEYALMKSGMIIDFFPDRQSALLAGHQRFLDRLFSVHRVLPHERRRGGEAAPLVERRRAGI
jgi:hypothetical protein